MAVIKRSTKGAPLTHAEMDGNMDEILLRATKSGTVLDDTLTVNTNALVVNSAKNVGIGTTAPNYSLHINKTAASIQLTDPSQGSGATNGFRLWKTATGAAIWNYQNDHILIGVNDKERLRITSNGNLLIGTTTDDGVNKVQVNGGAKFTNLTATGEVGIGATAPQSVLNIERSSSDGTIATIPAIVLSNRNNTSGTFVASGIFSNTYRDITSASYTAGIWFEKQNSAISGAASSQGNIVFGAQRDVVAGTLPIERLRITSTGNILMGTTINDGVNMLQVNGGIAMNPTITTTAPSAGGAGALPATPTGYATMYIGGVARKIAYY